ncbi:MAG: chloride channel protein [Ignavibacteriales bacterium]|nr:MAG: chloride channel protein [Ignavibacteriales bacterium]
MKSLTKLYTKFSRSVADSIEKLKMTEYTFMISISVIIGVLAGFAAVLIRLMIHFVADIAFPGEGNFLQDVTNSAWYIILLVPMIGGLIVGPMIHFFAPEAKGHGVPEVMQAILLKGGKIRGRVAFIKTISSAITIGTGGSVGREGPIIQIGSSLGSLVGQFLRISSKRLKTFVGCGAAAGIAAAFNAPIAGALFAVEIILMDYAVVQFAPIIISAVVATLISHTFEGNFAAFLVPQFHLYSPYEIIIYLVLGLASGLVSYLFIKVLYFFEDFFDNKIQMQEYLKPVLGGLAIGLIALLYPQIMGVGYETMDDAFYGNLLWHTAFILIFVKIIATSITLGSGGSGGIFAPSLYMGAMLGYAFGVLSNNLFPDITAPAGAYAVVAMGGLVAGTARAPLTAIIIVFELTNDYRIILPLMVTCIISTLVSSKLSRESIYTLKLLLKNIGIREGAEINVMESIYVRDVFSKEFDVIREHENFNLVVNRVLRSKSPEFPVLNSEDEIKGMISIYDIKEHLFEKESLKDLLIAGDFADPVFNTAFPDENCQAALDKMKKHDYEGIPVVESPGSKKILGMLWRKDIQDAYQKEIENRDITSTLASSISMKDDEHHHRFMEGYSIVEIKPPASFIGRSIRQLNIRKEYGVDVLSIKTKEKKGERINAIPNPDYVIKIDDTLLIAGEVKNINLLQSVN